VEMRRASRRLVSKWRFSCHDSTPNFDRTNSGGGVQSELRGFEKGVGGRVVCWMLAGPKYDVVSQPSSRVPPQG
jgi:hypothetical protein